MEFQLFKKKVLAPFQCFIPISAFYPRFSVFFPILAFYPQFSVLSSFQCFIPISVFYPHFSVVSPFQCFIPISAFYSHFSFRFQFPFQPFSFSVLSRPNLLDPVLYLQKIRFQTNYFLLARYDSKKIQE